MRWIRNRHIDLFLCNYIFAHGAAHHSPTTYYKGMISIMSTSRKPWKRVFIALLVLLVVIALGEVVLEIIGFGHPALAVLNDTVQYELMPNQHVRRLWPLSDSWVAHLDTNQYGMRSMPVSSVKPPNTFRLYFLGDSITYGTTQVDQSEIFTDLVRRDLPSIVHEPVEVMDGAMGGWAIANELAYLKEHGTLQADRVILVLNDGDPSQPLSPKPHGYGIPTVEYNPKWGYSELWYRVIAGHLHFFFKDHGIPLLQTGLYQDPGLEVTDDAAVIQQNLQYLDEMRAYLQQNNTPFSILLIPFPGTYQDPKLAKIAAVARSVIHKWAAQNQVPFLDIAPDIFTPHPYDILLRDHAHLNVKGNRAVATAIERNWATLAPTPTQAASVQMPKTTAAK
jgi:hypothetical protein